MYNQGGAGMPQQPSQHHAPQPGYPYVNTSQPMMSGGGPSMSQQQSS